jgi:hypothetical protein
MSCHKCNSNDWAMGPEGGGSQNVLCRVCHTEYCESARGLDQLEYDERRIRNIYGIAPNKSVEEHKPGYSIIDSMLENLDAIGK